METLSNNSLEKQGEQQETKVEKCSPKHEDLKELSQDIIDEAINNFDPISNEMSEYTLVDNKKDVDDLNDEMEDNPGIKHPESVEINHACGCCPRTTSHDCKLQENNAGIEKKMKMKMLSCRSCDEEMATPHMDGDYECFECGNFFILKSIMERHHLMVHCKANVFKCPNCEFICTDKDILTDHLYSKYYSGTSRLHSCTVCFKSFSRKDHLLRHNTQTGCDGSVKLKFSCEVCGKTFDRKDKLGKHHRVHDRTTRKKRTFYCEYCNKGFVGLLLLNDHRKTHSAFRRHQCDFCLKQLSSSGSLRNHRRIHTGERPFECKQCLDKFTIKKTLDRHFETHHAIKPKSGALTGKFFELNSQQKAHLFHDNSGNAFTCDKCCVTFSSRSYYDHHIQLVHNSITGLYLCNVCDKILLQNEDVQPRHIIPPGINGRHSCLICELQFTSPIFLNLHMVKHTKKPQRPCVECGRTFIRQGWLLYNLRSKNRDLLAELMADHEDGNTDALEDNDNATSNDSNQKDAFADSVMELLTVLIDESTLKEFGWPNMSVDHLIESVIKRFGHTPVAYLGISYLNKLRGNTKQLFSIIIEDSAIKKLLSDYTYEKVKEQVFKLSKLNNKKYRINK